MISKTFLIEIGTEELPAKKLCKIALSFYKNFISELKKNNISYKTILWFATPRRLAIQVTNINILNEIIQIQKRGPSKQDSFDEQGLPTVAALKWAEHCGIDIKQSTILKNKKGEWITCQIEKKSESIYSILPKISILALEKISVKNTMIWNNKKYKFFRPIRNIVMLINKTIIPGKIYGVSSNNLIHNHICQKEKNITIQDAAQYSSILLEKCNIIANYNVRKEKINKDIKEIVKKINGYIEIKPSLLEEVNALVESPVVILANFPVKFLKIPKEILIYTIEYHQKCFTIYNKQKTLLPYFIFVTNIYNSDKKNIIQGYEKVIHARLSDTEFFIQKDREKKLETSLQFLKNVIFQKKLGTLYDKTLRLKLLVKWLSDYTYSNKKNVIRGAILSKCDLISNMVCEFPELQGTIGMYYALADKEEKTVAMSIKEQYLPAFSGDKLPTTVEGYTLSIADKIDTLSGMFLTGQIPTSDKDPFALRRLTISILRIIITKKIPLDLKKLIYQSMSIYSKYPQDHKIYNNIIEFFLARLFYWYEEKRINVKIIQSVLSYKLTEPVDIDKRIQAVCLFKMSKSFKDIILLIKRISKILEKNNQNLSKKIDINLIVEDAEKKLFDKTIIFVNQTKILSKEKKYEEIFIEIYKLEEPINNFFNQVQINHSNFKIRNNRLTLLNVIHKNIFIITNFNYLY